jgi:adenosylmethionine-8-amino-7-oxononanoate aminotransferase
MIGLGPKVAAIIRKHGVIVRGLANLIAISPCLNITRAEVDELFAKVKAGLDEFIASEQTP